MIIGIEFRPGQRLEAELEHMSKDRWRCGLRIHTKFSVIRPSGTGNPAGVLWAFEQWHEKANMTEREIERDRRRCKYDFPWPCPHPDFPCLYPTRNKKRLVRIGYIVHRQKLIPIGQMSLWEPDRTQRIVWEHIVTGQIAEGDEPDPITYLSAACKERAATIVRWLERKAGYEVVRWRIKPLSNYKADRRWCDEQAANGQLPACTFYDL